MGHKYVDVILEQPLYSKFKSNYNTNPPSTHYNFGLLTTQFHKQIHPPTLTFSGNHDFYFQRKLDNI